MSPQAQANSHPPQRNRHVNTRVTNVSPHVSVRPTWQGIAWHGMAWHGRECAHSGPHAYIPAPAATLVAACAWGASPVPAAPSRACSGRTHSQTARRLCERERGEQQVVSVTAVVAAWQVSGGQKQRTPSCTLSYTLMHILTHHGEGGHAC